MSNIAAIILAGGVGKRMDSNLAKVLHQVGNKPIIYYILKTLQKMGIADVTVVVFHQANQVKQEILKNHSVKFATQNAAQGTADALKTGLSKINPDTKIVLVFNGDDSAFYQSETIEAFITSHLNSQASISIMGLKNSEKQLGRIFRDSNGEFDQLLEPNQYLSLSKQSDEVNCGAYIFDYNWLKQNIDHVPLNEQKREFYITELPNMAKQQKLKINVFTLQDPNQWIGINTQEELAYANEKMQELKKI